MFFIFFSSRKCTAFPLSCSLSQNILSKLASQHLTCKSKFNTKLFLFQIQVNGQVLLQHAQISVSNGQDEPDPTNVSTFFRLCLNIIRLKTNFSFVYSRMSRVSVKSSTIKYSKDIKLIQSQSR